MSARPRSPLTGTRWSTGAFQTRILPVAAGGPTKFEQLVEAVGLQNRPDLWRHHDKLRRFARAHHNTHWIPEWFLHELSIPVREENCA